VQSYFLELRNSDPKACFGAGSHNPAHKCVKHVCATSIQCDRPSRTRSDVKHKCYLVTDAPASVTDVKHICATRNAQAVLNFKEYQSLGIPNLKNRLFKAKGGFVSSKNSQRNKQECRDKVTRTTQIIRAMRVCRRLSETNRLHQKNQSTNIVRTEFDDENAKKNARMRNVSQTKILHEDSIGASANADIFASSLNVTRTLRTQESFGTKVDIRNPIILDKSGLVRQISLTKRLFHSSLNYELDKVQTRQTTSQLTKTKNYELCL